MNYKIIFLIMILLSCSSHEYKRFKKKKVRVDLITRLDKDVFYKEEIFQKKELPVYPFEKESYGLIKITKEFFRCKGNPLNPERVDASNKDDVKVYLDCEGALKHSLPLVNGKEGVYPILIDLLNYIQSKTKKRVCITCAHRCPKHNAYADIFNNAKNSRHMIGAEVDFYVEGMENTPEEVINLIFQFYKENNRYRNLKEFEEFSVSQKEEDVSTKPWFNKEIFVKLYQYNEGRDFNNRHPYPYISIQVLWDRYSKQKVNYSWDKAYRGYLY